jgi:hypothetical protein
MTRKPIHRFLPLTYKPKIPGVLTGTINQSIRIDTDLQEGDLIAFHGWEGKPYRSPWSFRTPFMPVTMAMPVNIRKNDSVYFPETGETYKHPSDFLNTLTALDGIDPPTTVELIRVLRSMHGKGYLHGKILRWDPDPLFYRVFSGDEPIEQVHAIITESAPLIPPGQDFIQIGFCKEVL